MGCKAGDVMHTDLVVARPDESLTSLQHRLVEKRISAMPVVEDGKLVGVISHSDLVRVPVLLEAMQAYAQSEMLESGPANGGSATPRPFEEFLDLGSQLKVRDAMREQLVTCSVDSSLSEVAGKLVKNHVHRVIVVDEELRPLGILSSLDVVQLLLQERSDA